ncbi:MAG: twin-arginine translocase subunit TatC [Gammaproteobacteria bacterium]|nr:twin-arginine translocase subunit TatC [Gammaproteobacteria bacterium]
MKPDKNYSAEMPFLAHLFEVRDRLMRILVAVLLIFCCLFPFANEIYLLLAEPLTRHLPAGGSMIATQVASPFLTPFKLSLVLSFFVAIPYILYQMWSFIAPGLYQHERRLVMPLIISSSALYYVGMAFAYFIVFPVMFGFFTSVTPQGVAVMTDITSYLDFVLKLFFAFGVAFEVPVAVFIAIATGVTTVTALEKKRPYIIVIAFVVGMLLTPPDVLSQTLLAVPMLILFEGGLFVSRIFLRKREAATDDAVTVTPTAADSTGQKTTAKRYDRDSGALGDDHWKGQE